MLSAHPARDLRINTYCYQQNQPRAEGSTYRSGPSLSRAARKDEAGDRLGFLEVGAMTPRLSGNPSRSNRYSAR